MITGSFASNLYGVPRATQDAHVVIEADQGSLDRFLQPRRISSAQPTSPHTPGKRRQPNTIPGLSHAAERGIISNPLDSHGGRVYRVGADWSH
jgi:hypothetical protein